MKKVVIGIIIGALVSGMSVYAGISLSSEKIGYNNTTVKDSLDNLFTEAVDGKNSITTALSNKGFNVNNNSTYTDIVNGINELPVTIGKDEDGNYGYYKNDNSFVSFNENNDIPIVLAFQGTSSDATMYNSSCFFTDERYFEKYSTLHYKIKRAGKYQINWYGGAAVTFRIGHSSDGIQWDDLGNYVNQALQQGVAQFTISDADIGTYIDSYIQGNSGRSYYYFFTIQYLGGNV